MTCYVVEIDGYSPALVGETREVVTVCVFDSREFDLCFAKLVPVVPGVPVFALPREAVLWVVCLSWASVPSCIDKREFDALDAVTRVALSTVRATFVLG